MGDSGFLFWCDHCRSTDTPSVCFLGHCIFQSESMDRQFCLGHAGAQNLYRHTDFETELLRQNAEQPPGRSAGIPALMLQVFHLLDRDTKPLRELGLGHTGVLPQSQDTACSPFHHSA